MTMHPGRTNLTPGLTEEDIVRRAERERGRSYDQFLRRQTRLFKLAVCTVLLAAGMAIAAIYWGR